MSTEHRLTHIDEDIFCPQCNYNLRGIETRRCPECGLEFDPAKLRTSAIPWIHRQEIGWFRAYWRTAWLFTAKTKLFAEELCRPVSYASPLEPPVAQRNRLGLAHLALSRFTIHEK